MDKPSSLLKAATLSLLALCAACSREATPPAADANAPAALSDPLPPGSPLETRPPNGVDFKPAFAGQTRAPGIKSEFAIDVAVVAKDLNGAWAFEFLPDQRILVTERQGNLRIVDKDGKVSAPLKGLPKVYFEGQGGLLDVALDPQFATNRTIYWSFAEPRDGGNGTALAKGVLSKDDSGRRERASDLPPDADVGFETALRLAHRVRPGWQTVPGARRALACPKHACSRRT